MGPREEEKKGTSMGSLPGGYKPFRPDPKKVMPVGNTGGGLVGALRTGIKAATTPLAHSGAGEALQTGIKAAMTPFAHVGAVGALQTAMNPSAPTVSSSSPVTKANKSAAAGPPAPPPGMGQGAILRPGTPAYETAMTAWQKATNARPVVAAGGSEPLYQHGTKNYKGQMTGISRIAPGAGSVGFADKSETAGMDQAQATQYNVDAINRQTAAMADRNQAFQEANQFRFGAPSVGTPGGNFGDEAMMAERIRSMINPIGGSNRQQRNMREAGLQMAAMDQKQLPEQMSPYQQGMLNLEQQRFQAQQQQALPQQQFDNQMVQLKQRALAGDQGAMQALQSLQGKAASYEPVSVKQFDDAGMQTGEQVMSFNKSTGMVRPTLPNKAMEALRANPDLAKDPQFQAEAQQWWAKQGW